MTDLERFIELYRSFGIECKIEQDKEPYAMNNGHLINDTKSITLIEGTGYRDSHTISERFTGYCSFFSCIVFDKDGKFVEQGFYE